jgi:outer membrane protein assembly factor BamB
MIVNGYKRIAGFDIQSGKELWWMKGGGDIPVPTPIVAHDLIFITNAHGALAPIYAISPAAEGDISIASDGTRSPHMSWAQLRTGNYMQTPLVYGDLLYACRDAGILACYDAKTGDKKYRERLSDGVGFTASPVAGDGKVYFTSEEGDVHVVKAGPSFELLGKNSLGDVSMATPAISNGTLYFRTRGHLVAVGTR